ncbi:MAG: hypothetical protein L0312_19020, partial [Acidobacteria bacterium]|nr:hypothetical protein [Acidobacteriota bacterium]
TTPAQAAPAPAPPQPRRGAKMSNFQNGEAVMNLLHELHGEGATICMVTHDPRFSRHAERTIQLFDGTVVEETVEA